MPRISERISLLLLALVVLAGVFPRMVFFWVSPGAGENFLGEILVAQFQLFLTIIGFSHRLFAAASLGMLLLVIVLMVLAVRLTHYLRTRKRTLPPESLGLLVLGMVFFQFFFDLSFGLMLTLVALLAVLALARRLLPAPRTRLLWPAFLLPAALSLLWLDWGECVAVLLFCLAAAVGHFAVSRGRLSTALANILLIYVVPVAQLTAAWLPSVTVLPKAHRFSSVPAMSFCESHSLDALVAVHPQCPMAMFADKCRDGYLGIYDRQTLALRDKVQIYDENYYGRPEQIVCNDNQLYVGMNAVRQSGQILGPNALLVDLGNNKVRLWKNFGGANIGNHVLYDKARDALFLTAEFSQQIHRWDFKKQAMTTGLGDAIVNPWLRWLTGTEQSGSLISHQDGMSEKRHTAYFSEWINGRFVHEIDLASLKPLRRFRFNGGASVGSTVDEERNTLWVTHLWGISVFDLETGALLAKHRAGFVNRPAVVDRENGLVFFVSTVRGRLFIFDRKTMRPITTVALGLGGRYLHIAPDLKRLYASSWSGSYALDLGAGSDFLRQIHKRRETN